MYATLRLDYGPMRAPRRMSRPIPLAFTATPPLFGCHPFTAVCSPSATRLASLANLDASLTLRKDPRRNIFI